MSWEIGYDSNWNRWIGYGVPAYCDHPDCNEEINRGLSYICGSDPYGGEHGCGLYFCTEHRCIAGNKRRHAALCECCYPNRGKVFTPKPEHPDWLRHVLTDESWAQWRAENPEKVEAMKRMLAEAAGRVVP